MKTLALIFVFALNGCAWMAAHPTQVAGIAAGAAIAQSATGAVLNVERMIEEKK